MNTILVCDDERDIVNALRIYLESEGYRVLSAYHGKQVLELLLHESVQLVLLDIMMPELDGLKTLHCIREQSNVPVILLTAKSEDTDKILGLNLGADDYITKPFNPIEVLARVRSQLRRYLHLGSGQSQSELTIGGIRLYDASKVVTVDGEPIALTPSEYDILKLLMENPDTVFSPQEIYRRIHGEDPFGADSTIAVHIRHLREKIEINPAEPRYLRVKWGKGYMICK
ncbi:MAG: response regulator transcription factor [Clostridia bacterium]|nr:response regulator transcription factor [Clostridia bacterium]